MRRRVPRPAAVAVEALAADVAPVTALARVQRAWPEVAGTAIAAQARPTTERDGLVTVSCFAAVWAHELTLMAPELAERLNEALGEPLVRALRCVATPP